MASTSQELLCFIDWLAVSLRLGSEVRPIPNHVWKEYTPTNVWGKRRVLWSNEGDRVLTLLSEPRSETFLGSKAALLEVDNEWLYHGLGGDGALALLSKACFFEVLGISRLDLCCDFVPTKHQKHIIEGLANKTHYVGSKQNGSLFWSTNKSEHLHEMWRNRRIPHQQSWGHKTSAIKWKLYYKTKELWDAGGDVVMHKPYIVDHWRMNGFDETNVWRLEVSMQHLNDYNLYGRRITLEEVAHHRSEIFAGMYSARFKVRRDQGHKDKSNDRIVQFLPIEDIGRVVTKRPPSLLAQHDGRLTLLRHLVRSLDDEQVLLDEPSRNAVFQHMYSIIDRDGLQNYFHKITGCFFDEFCAAKDNEAIELIAQQNEETSQVYEAQGGRFDGQVLYDIERNPQGVRSLPNMDFERYDEEGNPIPDKSNVEAWNAYLDEKIHREFPSISAGEQKPRQMRLELP